jgi:hypothetical protein
MEIVTIPVGPVQLQLVAKEIRVGVEPRTLDVNELSGDHACGLDATSSTLAAIQVLEKMLQLHEPDGVRHTVQLGGIPQLDIAARSLRQLDLAGTQIDAKTACASRYFLAKSIELSSPQPNSTKSYCRALSFSSTRL